ncbi:MAG TPA: DUF3971 domain-containing protein, partial [Alphaproteobacteria bacterium]|nr:DUF3971 domain-containing protein [Alphaproteobacteria bacterium]
MIRRSARFAAAVLAALLTPVLLAAVVAVAVLAQGPVSLPLLNRQLAGALSAVDPQLRASIGDTVLAWNSGSHRLEIRLVDARITDPQGAPLAAFGSARVDLSGLDLLLGRIVPTAVQLIRPELRVLREADGTLYLQAEAGGEDWPLARLLAAFGNRPHQGEERRLLRQLSARHARLTFEDRGSGFTATTDDAALSAIDGEGATSLSFDAAMRIRGEPVRIGLGAVRHDGAQAFDVSLHFSELALGSLPAMTGLAALAPLDGAEPALNGNVDFTLVPDGRLGEVSFLVDVGSGAVPLPDRLPEPLQVQRGHLRGSVQPVSGHVVLSDVQLAMTDGLNLYYAGEASDVLGTPAITGSGGFQDLQVSRLANYWPRGVARGARAWVTQHVSGGTIPAAQLKLDIRPGELSAAEPRAGMAELTWRFKGVRSDYLGKLPPLREAEGSGHVDAHSFRLEVERAQVLDLAVSNGEVSVPDLGMKIPRIDIAMQVDGPAGSALKVIDADPLNYVRAIGLNAARVGGRASVKTTLSFPLDADLKLEQIDFTSTAQVHGFSAPYIIGGRPVSRGDMALKAQQSGLQAGGTVRVSGVPLSVEWRKPTGRPAEVTLAVHSETGKGTVLRDIDLQTPGLAFRGTVALDPE